MPNKYAANIWNKTINICILIYFNKVQYNKVYRIVFEKVQQYFNSISIEFVYEECILNDKLKQL